MQLIIQEIVDTIIDFISSEEQFVLILDAEQDSTPLLLKSLSIVEESTEVPDIFLSVGDEFSDIRRYTEAMIDNVSVQIDGMNEELAKRGEPLIEQIPEELKGRDMPSSDRLLGLFKHTRSIVDADRQINWVLYPLQDVEREEFFADFLAPAINDICTGNVAGTKLIVRDTPGDLLRERYGVAPDSPKFAYYKADLDFKSVLNKIEENAKDKNASPDERAQSIMLMAGVDIAEKRYDDALVKNQAVLKHYKANKQRQNESIVQNNIGDIYYLQGDYPTAQKNYEKAVLISVEEKSQPMVLYQSMNLGNALFMQQKYDEALIYYDSAEKLAEANKVLVHRVQAMERKGDTLRGKGELDDAAEQYGVTADLCREEKYSLGLKSVLERTVELEEQRGDNEKRDAAADELEKCRQEIRKLDPNFVDV